MMRRAACIAALALTCLSAAADDDARLKQSTQSLQDLRSRIQALDRELDRARGQRDDLQAQVEAAEARLEDLRSRLQDQRKRIVEQTAALRDTRAQRSGAERKLAEQQHLLARQIRAAYVMGSGGTAGLLFSGRDPSLMQRLLVDYEALNRARGRVIGGIRERQRALLELESRQQAQSKQLAREQAQQEKLLAEQDADRAERLRTVQKLAGRIAGGEAELEQLRTGERALVTLIGRLKDLLAQTPAEFHGDGPLGRQKGRLPWPLRGKLLARYGAPKAGGKLKWTGLWIAAPEGAPIRVVANGRVAYVGHLQRYGLIAVVEHGGGYYTLYGHNAEVEKQAGDPVRAGEVLARAGNSGGHEESGLYFELRKGADPVNPLDWLVR